MKLPLRQHIRFIKMKNSVVLDAARKRFACKKYLDKEIDREALKTILESGRLAPTAFGMEHFDIYVMRSKDIIDVCFNQESMKTAPITLVLTVKKSGFYDPDGKFVRSRGERFPGTIKEYVEDYRGYHDYLASKGQLDSWAKAQAYLPLSFMMLTAAELGVQSCAIEGFDNDKLIERMGLDGNEDQVSCLLALGYPDETRERIRRDFSDVVKYRD